MFETGHTIDQTINDINYSCCQREDHIWKNNSQKKICCEFDEASETGNNSKIFFYQQRCNRCKR